MKSIPNRLLRAGCAATLGVALWGMAHAQVPAASAAPAPGQPIGFGSTNDRLEVRLELEPRPGDKPQG